jgi:AAA family ATP:ADP antiporter
MADSDHLATPARKNILDRVLSLAGEVRPGEGVTAMLLTVNGFLLLSAYYTIRPLRSALLLPVHIPLPGGGSLAGPEIQSYTGAILAALFLVIVPLYSSFASRVDRIRLINSVTMFFVVTLIGFFFIGGLGVFPTTVAVTFFLWIGVFNLMIIAQFWSFANDLYTPEQGKRLFAIVGFGGSVGAIGGALIVSTFIGRMGILPMMLIAAAELLSALAITNVIHKREQRRPRAVTAKADEKPLASGGGFKLVLSQRYLLLIGVLTMTVQLVNTNGNYILNETLASMARATIAAGNSAQTEGQIIGSYMAGTDFWQNLLSMLIQFFLVSRIFKYLGIGGALFILPTLALGSYGLFAFAPVLAFIRLTKIVENAADYSVQNTVRRALFLPTSREAKYKALQAVETFFWRAGDMLSAVVTFVLVQWLAFSVRGFAFVNLAIVAVWLLLAASLARENRRLTADTEAAAA